MEKFRAENTYMIIINVELYGDTNRKKSNPYPGN